MICVVLLFSPVGWVRLSFPLAQESDFFHRLSHSDGISPQQWADVTDVAPLMDALMYGLMDGWKNGWIDVFRSLQLTLNVGEDTRCGCPWWFASAGGVTMRCSTLVDPSHISNLVRL